MIRILAVALFSTVLILNSLLNSKQVFAAKPPPVKEIVYIPHDDRPISLKQTAEVIEKAGYKIITPPQNLLGNRNSMGNSDELWKWYENFMKKASKDKKVKIVASVLSSDSLLYGSLVGSRKHNFAEKNILARVKKFANIRKKAGRDFLPTANFNRINR